MKGMAHSVKCYRKMKYNQKRPFDLVIRRAGVVLLLQFQFGGYGSSLESSELQSKWKIESRKNIKYFSEEVIYEVKM